jgi:dihydrofolate reductase
MPAGDMFGDMMNAPAKYVVSKTLEKPIWRNTTIIRDDVVNAVKKLKAAAGKDILTDGSGQLVQTLLANELVDELHLLLYPLSLGGGKSIFPKGSLTKFKLKGTKAYPTGVVDLHYELQR